MSNQTLVVVSMTIGAWLNIWPCVIFQNRWASFIFAYALALLGTAFLVRDSMKRDAK